MSEPVQIGIMSQASATADPPEDPPQVRAVSKGLRVAPYTSLTVLAPAPNSGVLVLPSAIAPARLSAATMRSSLSGT